MISTHKPSSDGATVRQSLAITPSATALARMAMTVIRSWTNRHRHRQALAELDDHMLRDIGLTRHQARMEAWKPFWRD